MEYKEINLKTLIIVFLQLLIITIISIHLCNLEIENTNYRNTINYLKEINSSYKKAIDSIDSPLYEILEDYAVRKKTN